MSCAWVFVIWGDPKYLVGAVAAAHSLRMVKTRHKCVLLHSVDDIQQYNLNRVFDEIKRVPMLEFEYKDLRTIRQRQLYGGVFSKQINTKWHVLSLEKYRKVAYLDADLVFIKNPDELFQLDCPAATFSNAYAVPYMPKGIPNAYGMLKHGDKIPPTKILQALNGSFSGFGALYIFEPSRAVFREYVKWMRSQEPYGHAKSFSGIDEQSICEFYARKRATWTHIHQKYQIIPWRTNWWPESKNVLRDAYALHYFHDKPWEKGEGSDWPDVVIWWKVYHSFERAHTDIAKRMRPLLTFYKSSSKQKIRSNKK